MGTERRTSSTILCSKRSSGVEKTWLNWLSGYIPSRHGWELKKDLIMEPELDLRQPFSSLSSKQSGNPSHCQPPGTHIPSPHMKFPGMLHSVVKLFPGSSWLSDGSTDRREGERRTTRKRTHYYKSQSMTKKHPDRRSDIALKRYSSQQSKWETLIISLLSR